MLTRELTRRAPAATVEDLFAGAESREPMKTADSKSSAQFERVTIAGERYVVKHFSGDDWLAEASADTTARAVSMWEEGVYDATADIVDSTVVGAARDGDLYPAALLMRDAGDVLLPVDAAVDARTHAAIVEAMAALHARFWERPPLATYMPFALTYSILSPAQARAERAHLDRSDVLRMVEPGWREVLADVPALRAVLPLLDDATRLVRALATTPKTFVHSDFKMGNLGCHPGGTIVLLDWDRPTIGPATTDLAWYLAVNCDRLPESKDDTVARYRDALEARGVATREWWNTQLPLALLGGFLQLGWSKAGQPDELAWWAERVVPVAQSL
jgi:hypothetical protein